jgi:hypothetical protein
MSQPTGTLKIEWTGTVLEGEALIQGVPISQWRALFAAHGYALNASTTPTAVEQIRARVLSRLGDRAFYDLMQRYRHAPTADQPLVTAAFDAVQQYVYESVDGEGGGTVPAPPVVSSAFAALYSAAALLIFREEDERGNTPDEDYELLERTLVELKPLFEALVPEAHGLAADVEKLGAVLREPPDYVLMTAHELCKNLRTREDG